MLNKLLRTIASYLSFKYYKFRYLRGVNIARSISICPPFYIENARNVIFKGAFCYVGPHSYIAAKGGVEFGENVILGPKVSIWSYSHNYLSPESVPYGGEDVLGRVIIGSNVWIGYGAVILPGTHIGDGCIVGAGAVVKGTFECCSVIVGNPAKVIKRVDVDRYNSLVSSGRLYLPIKEARKNG